eukprot:1183660-Prorocentrum_minimum.AAC.4
MRSFPFPSPLAGVHVGFAIPQQPPRHIRSSFSHKPTSPGDYTSERARGLPSPCHSTACYLYLYYTSHCQQFGQRQDEIDSRPPAGVHTALCILLRPALQTAFLPALSRSKDADGGGARSRVAMRSIASSPGRRLLLEVRVAVPPFAKLLVLVITLLVVARTLYPTHHQA